jgi:hypothetical protein
VLLYHAACRLIKEDSNLCENVRSHKKQEGTVHESRHPQRTLVEVCDV